MILKKSIHMVPLLLSLNAYAAPFKQTKTSVTEKDAKNNTANFSPDALRSIMINDSFGHDDLYMKNRIKGYVDKWEKETAIFSDPRKIVKNKNFQNIVAFGERAVPYIVEILKEKPSALVWSLNIIYDRNISNSSISIEDASKAWIRYLSQRNPA